MENHENPPNTMKKQPGTIKDHENPPGTMKNQPGTMKPHLEPWKTNLEPWKTMKTHMGSNQPPLMPNMWRHRQGAPTDLLDV